MDNKAQGALEYLLLIGGAILIAAVVIVLLSASGLIGKGTAHTSTTKYNEEINKLKHQLP